MRMNYVKRVKSEVETVGKYSKEFSSLLAERGISDIEAFINPSLDDMCDPFSLDGISDAVNRINEAKNDSVLIYGDYDCDGICATVILYKILSGRVKAVNYFIPDRNVDGYGLSVNSLEKLLKKYSPDLVITVDCGITSSDEVEFLKDRGVDVIVTDHHEPQNNLPDCIKINPKIKREGFSDYCGAGVALKLAEALSSREDIKPLLELAAIATIADIVPLCGENRVIASLGLDCIKKKPSKAIKRLIGKSVSSYEIMFKTAPKINAAGRMDNAMKAVEMFLCDDDFIIDGIVKELEFNNTQRQIKCEEAFRDSVKMLSGTNFDNLGFIVLYSEKWEAGILGIAASRLVEKYHRPCLLFSKKGDVLKGSARSVSEINLFETLKGISEHFLSFGGHAMAAGVSISADKFDTVKNLLNEKALSYGAETFFERVYYDFEADTVLPKLPLARELELLEPTGYKNPKPLFLVPSGGIAFDRIGDSEHIKANTKAFEMVGFFKHDRRFMAECDSRFVVSLSRNIFQNNETAQALIKDVYVENVTLSNDELMTAALGALKLPPAECDGATDFKAEGSFGTLFVAFSKEGLSLIENDYPALPIGICAQAVSNMQNQIVLCPDSDFDFSEFERVVFYEKPISGIYKKAKDECAFVCIVAGAPEQKINKISRASLEKLFIYFKGKKGLKYNEKKFKSELNKAGLADFEFFAGLQIFKELLLILTDDKGIIVISDKKTSLDKSYTYQYLKEC